MGYLAECMNAGIGPATSHDFNVGFEQYRDGFAYNLLQTTGILLFLPAMIIGSGICYFSEIPQLIRLNHVKLLLDDEFSRENRILGVAR